MDKSSEEEEKTEDLEFESTTKNDDEESEANKDNAKRVTFKMTEKVTSTEVSYTGSI